MKVKGKMAVKKEPEFHITTCARSHFVKESQKESEDFIQKIGVVWKQIRLELKLIDQTDIHSHRRQFTSIILRNAAIGDKHVELFRASNQTETLPIKF